jgi:hypothetical protein
VPPDGETSEALGSVDGLEAVGDALVEGGISLYVISISINS